MVPSAIERHVSSQSVQLTCTAYGLPPPNVTWTRLPATELIAGEDLLIASNITTANDSEAAFVTSTLTLCDVQLTNAGRYRCSASNSVNRKAPAGSNSSWEFSLSVIPQGIYMIRIIIILSTPARFQSPFLMILQNQLGLFFNHAPMRLYWLIRL